MKRIHVIGLDVSKDKFQVHAVDKSGAVVARRKLRRKEVAPYFKQLKPCIIGIEATGGIHHWARLFNSMGHTAKIMPAAYVKPYVKSNKNDAIDAEAICEAVRRPTMRFVAVKTEVQQAMMTMHRARQMLTQQRVMLSNAMRGFLAEFGIIVRVGSLGTEEVLRIANSTSSTIPEAAQGTLKALADLYQFAMKQIEILEKAIKAAARSNADSKRLETIPGVGPLLATALVASIGSHSQFKSGRQMAAWLGLVPRQFSSGDKIVLGHINKRGNTYLRQLFFLSGMSLVLTGSKQKIARWAQRLMKRKPYRVAVIALANKLARIAWALLAHKEDYDAKRTNFARA